MENHLLTELPSDVYHSLPRGGRYQKLLPVGRNRDRI